jgi:membrane fusion protein
VTIATTEVTSYTRELDVRKKAAALAEESAVIAGKLAKIKAVADLEFLRIRLEMDKANLDREETERALSVAKLRLDQLKNTEAKQQTEFKQVLDQLETERRENETALAKHRLHAQVQQSEAVEKERSLQEALDKATIRIAALQAELDRTKGNEVRVEAPCAGSILRLRVKGTGSFVRTGEVLCELAASGQQLQAELAVPPARVGRIQAEQRVKLLYDAYPYQRYGIQLGTVRWLSPASVQGADGAVFRVLADNDSQTIRVSGQDRALLAGMGGRAEVVVGRRSLISFSSSQSPC